MEDAGAEEVPLWKTSDWEVVRTKLRAFTSEPSAAGEALANFMVKYQDAAIDRNLASNRAWVGVKMPHCDSFTLESLMEKLQQNDAEFVGAVAELSAGGFLIFGRKKRSSLVVWNGIDITVDEHYGYFKVNQRSRALDKEYMTLVLTDIVKVGVRALTNYDIRNIRSTPTDDTSELCRELIDMDIMEFEKEAGDAKNTQVKKRNRRQAYIVSAYIHIVKMRQEDRATSSSKAFLMIKVTDPTIMKFSKDFGESLYNLEVFSINVIPGDPLNGTDQIMSLSDYVWNGEYAEKALVLYGKAGTGKSVAVRSMARNIALSEAEEDCNEENSKAFFLQVNTVEGLHGVVELINPSIPIIFQELTPSNTQDGETKPMNIQIVKNLTSVLETTDSKKRYQNVILPLGTPRFFTSNCKSMHGWLEEIPDNIRTMSVESRLLNLTDDVMAVFRRVAFCYVGDSVIPANKRKMFNEERKAQAKAKMARFR